MIDLPEVLETLRSRGYERPFDLGRDGDEVKVNDVVFVDAGTDPGDEVTVYLLETAAGVRRYLLVSDSFHADPRMALFVDELVRRAR